MQFHSATREHAKARIALIGPSGSGKTKSALLIAHGLGGRIALIDTEHGSASKYADQGVAFETLELASFAPATYIEAIQTAQRAGFDTLIIDSLSHAWMGKDGALEMVDSIAKRSQSGNSFVAWREVTPHHNRLVEALVSCPMHLIVTMRSKVEYVIEDVDRGGGKTVKQPRKVGMAPIQRDGLEYEFDIVGDITLDHDWIISKTRCELFDKATIHKPGAEFAAQLLAWLQTGVASKLQLIAAPETPTVTGRRPVRRGPPLAKRRPASQPAAAEPAQPPAIPAAAKPEAGPCFSSTGKWAGAALWSGKPLASAPRDVLLEYDTVLGQAIANPANKARLRVLVDHRMRVHEAMSAAQPSKPVADADADGWDLSGQGTSAA